MTPYLTRRILLMIPTMILVAMSTFSLLRLVPGDTLTAQILSAGQPGVQYNEERVEALKEQLGLNGSVPEQFGRWVAGMARGDFQRSFVTNKGTLGEFAARVEPTVELGILSIIFSLIIGLPIGAVSALRQNSMIDYIGRFIAILALAIPNFAIALLVVVFSARQFSYAFPVGEHHIWTDPVVNLQQFVVPALIIAFATAGVLMRLTRTAMLDVLRQDYIRTARSKGLRSRVIVMRHALRNAMLPIVTVIGSQLATLVAGAVIIEQVFNIRGVGLQTLTAVYQRDYPQVQTNILIFAFVLVVGNLVTDLAYGALDPRIKQ